MDDFTRVVDEDDPVYPEDDAVMTTLPPTNDDDSPDVNTCCTECGRMIPTPERGGSYVCVPCAEADADYRAAFVADRDDDEQDADEDDSDHIYDPYAFADGH